MTDSEAEQTVQRWVREDEQAGGPHDEVARRSAFVTGQAIYSEFHAAFAQFFQGERCPGVTLIRSTLRRRTGSVQPRVVEEILHRILDRRPHLLENFRRKYQPSLFAPRVHNAARFKGYLARVALTESRLSAVPEAAHLASPGLESREPGESVSLEAFANLLNQFWSPDNRFRPDQRLEGLVSLGLGWLTGHDSLRENCRQLLQEKIGAWDNVRQSLHDRVSLLLARCDAVHWRVMAATTQADRVAAETELQALEDRLDRIGQRLAGHATRLWPKSAEVRQMLEGFVKQPGVVRFRRIRREVTLLRERVEQSRQDLTRVAVVPPPVRQLSDDVARHLAAWQGEFRDRPSTWTEEAGRILQQARRLTAELYQTALRPEVRQPLEAFLADVEDLYELGLLGRRGVAGGLGRRHGWRLEWLLRTPPEGKREGRGGVLPSPDSRSRTASDPSPGRQGERLQGGLDVPRAGVRPLPKAVANAAFLYMRYKLGSALTASTVGTLTVEDGVRTWHVPVYRRGPRELHGELLINEDGQSVRWVPQVG